ncbi:MAG: YadA-like family protein [Negativicoccus succinicivorans]|nr:YadA-like family protein [Negativicoccus succinicivorans]
MISKGKKSVALCAAVLTALSISCTIVSAEGEPAVPYFSVNSKDQMPNAEGKNSVAIGPGATTKFRNGLSVGTNNVNEGYETTLVGNQNKAYGLKPDVEWASGATLVGTNNTVMSTSGILAMGSKNIVHDGIAIGAGNKSMGQNAIALGEYSSAMYTDSIGIGFGTHSDADDVIAIGRAAAGDALGGVAIGRDAEVHASTGVALGFASTSERGAGVVGYMPGAVGQTAEEVAAYLGKAEEYKSWKADVEKNKDAYTRVKAWYDAVDAERQAFKEINEARIAYAENSTEENKKAITEKYDAWKKAQDLRSQTEKDSDQDRSTIDKLNARYGQIFGKLMSTGGAVSVGNEKEGITRQIVNVAAGTKDTDAVNVYQLRDAVKSFKQETNVAEDGKYVKKDKTAGENLTALDKEIDKLVTDSAVAEDGAYVKKDKKVGENLTALDNQVKANTGEIGGLKDGMTDLTGRMDKLGTDSAVAEDGAYVKKDKKVGENLTALDKQVQANAGEIGALANGMGALDSRVNKVGAGAAALAALHPLDFDPEDKWDFAAGYGHYKGANAVAIGAFYRPDENKMVSVGGSFGGGENMINVGVSFKVGEGDSPYAGVSKAQLAQRIRQQDEELAAQKAQIREILEQLAAMKKA